MLRCKNCGGNLVFDIQSQKVRCVFCDSRFAPEEYADDRGAEEYIQKEAAENSTDESGSYYETVVFTCTQCGAEIITTADAAVGFCSFCGTEAVLKSRISREKKPARIIPFRFTRKLCENAYMEAVKKEPYVPKEFLDPKFIEKFRGIYIPYWSYHAGFTKDPVLKVTSSYTSGDYNYTDTYNVNAQLSEFDTQFSYDASIAFDDELAAAIAPFSEDRMKEFSPAYLAGFFADTASADPSVYDREAVGKAQDNALESIKKDFTGTVTIDLPKSIEQRQEILGAEVRSRESVLCPVWFLTWRKGKRLAYGVLNGETGKLFAEIPVDVGAFLARTALIALAVFLVLTVGGLLILPAAMLMITTMIAFTAQMIYLTEIRTLRDREKHFHDPGALSGKTDVQIDKYMKAREKARKKSGGCILSIAILLLFLMVSVLWTGSNEGMCTGCTFLIFLCGLVVWILGLKPVMGVREKTMFIGMSLPLLAEMAAVIALLSEPVHDYIYYFAAFGGMAATAVTAFSMLLRYNRLCTRGIPDFHERKGGARYEAG